MTRETLEVDVLIVGGGPAGLSAAIRLSQLVKARGGEPLSIAVLEKAREAGAHLLSGAVLDLSALRELLPEYEALGAPVLAPVVRERVYFLTEHRALRAPVIPPPLANHGNAIISLNQFGRWLSGQAEAGGADLFTGFAGQEVLLDGSRVVGVRTGDRGRGKHGEPKPAFEPGVDIHAKVTIFCDGVRGNLTKQLHRRLAIGAGREPEQFAIGIKELWEVPAGRIDTGTVMHTLGHPLRHEEFGGGFVYALPDRMVSLGLVIGLDYHDPLFDPHVAFNRFKRHPLLARLLDGGRMVRYGAKALPEGGWNTVPRVHLDGALIAGDAAGFVNSVRLKGIHLAMRTGMLAAETAFESIAAGDTSAAALAAYQTRIDASAVRRELEPVRSVHQAFGHGLLPGLLYAGAAMVTRGRSLPDLHQVSGHRRMRTLRWYYGIEMASPAASRAIPPDRLLTFDKLTNVHFSGTAHDEDQPVHLLVHTEVCSSICGPEYGHPCTRFCPANVYEIVRETGAAPRLQINASNCVHCKTCDIMDPYGVITWVPPEGGGGPQYRHVMALDWRASRLKRFEAAAIAGLGYPLMAALGHTLRWRTSGLHHLDAIRAAGHQPVMAFWHGRILPATFYFRRRGIVVITSENFDGEWIARIIERFGYGTARGSTSSGGKRALLQLVRDMKSGRPAGFTLDGPRGPARVAQPGAVWLAMATGNPLLPFHLEASASWTARSWDRTQVPKPFSTVGLAVGEPLYVVAGASEAEREAVRLELEHRLVRLEAEAARLSSSR